MRQLLLTIKNRMVSVEQFLCALLLFGVMAVTVWGVFERFVIRMGMGWTDELARYLNFYCVFLGASLGVVKGSHIGVDVFVRLLPARMHRFMCVVSYIISAVFCLAIVWTGYDFFIRLMNSRQVSAAMRIPICWVFLSIPAGCALMFLHYILRLLTADLDVPDGDAADAPGQEGEKA